MGKPNASNVASPRKPRVGTETSKYPGNRNQTRFPKVVASEMGSRPNHYPSGCGVVNLNTEMLSISQGP